jgi:hypothetical protein
MTDEEAKAAQEVAKAVKVSMENLEQLDRMGSRIMGPLGQYWSWGTDLVAEARWRSVTKQRIINYLEIIQLAARKRAELGLSASIPIPITSRIGIQYQSGMEEEDDSSLQEMWANLLVNTTRTDGGREEPTRAFGDILRALDLDDARLFNVFARREELSQFWYASMRGTNEHPVSMFHYDLRPLVKALRDATDDFATIDEKDRCIEVADWLPRRSAQTIDRLRRQSLIEYAFDIEDATKKMVEQHPSPPPAVIVKPMPGGGVSFEGAMADIMPLTFRVTKYRVSELGRSFFRAVRGPLQNAEPAK